MRQWECSGRDYPLEVLQLFQEAIKPYQSLITKYSLIGVCTIQGPTMLASDSPLAPTPEQKRRSDLQEQLITLVTYSHE